MQNQRTSNLTYVYETSYLSIIAYVYDPYICQ